MKDVLLVTHIAVLSKKIAKGKLVEDAIDDLKEMTSKFDVSEESTASLGGAPFGSFSFYQSQNNGGVMTALGEWEEPELQQERQQQVSNLSASSAVFIVNIC